MIPDDPKTKRMKTRSDKRYAAPAVEQASRILFALAGSTSAELSLTEICRQVGVSGSKAFGILAALEKSGLIKRGKEGKGYSLGPGLITLSRKVLDDIIPSQLAEPVLEALTEESGSTSVFGLISGETVYIAAKRETEGDIRIVMRVGLTMPLTYGAHGKAIVAFLPEGERERILKREELYFHVEPGNLDRDLLAEELDRCRREGFACALTKSAPGITVVTAPVLGFTGVPVGFVEIFFPAPEKEARRYGPVVVRAGKALSRQLGANVGEDGPHCAGAA
jgi:DNA-binding IclR family transcriptional regulator